MFSMMPVGFTYRTDEYSVKLANLIRECHSNAENYKASNVLIFMAHKDKFDYLFYLDDATPFVDIGDILNNGCVPNISAQQGKSLQGAGLVASACAVHQDPFLLIASKIGKKFLVGTGRQESNRWVVEDSTKQWLPTLEQLVGVNELNKFNVVYGFRFNYQSEGDERGNDTRTMLKPKHMNMIAYMMGGLTDLKIHICEQEIGYPYKESSKRNKYSSFEKAVTGNKAGSIYRRALSNKGYCARFRENTWTIPCDPFKVEIASYDIILSVEKARIVVDYYPAITKGGSWMLNLRDGDEDGKFNKDSSNEFGNAPSRKAYLYCPWFYTWTQQNNINDARHYSRFVDNSVAIYKRNGNLLNDMNLPYHEKKGSFMVIQVFLDGFGELPNIKLTPHALFGPLGRRADFTFDNPSLVGNIMSAAAVAAANNVPTDLKQLCNERYKSDVTGFIPLILEGRKVHKSLTREKNVEIFDLDNDGKEFDGVLHAGSNYRLVFHDKLTNKTLSPKDVQIHPMTRGIDLVDFTDTIRQVNQKYEGVLDNLENQFSQPE